MIAAVTGGSGFIGQVIVKLLIERGHTVQALARSDAAAQFLESLGANVVRGDLQADDNLDRLCQNADVMFHSAARVDMSGRMDEFQRVSIDGTRRIVAAAVQQQIPKFIYVSSAGIYTPDNSGRAYCADYSPTVPRHYNPYGIAKAAGEQIVRELCRPAGVDWTMMRLGFVYGPECRWILERFVAMMDRKQLVIMGNGRNRMATNYVDDAARAIVLAGLTQASAGKIYDVASDEQVSQEQFVNAIAAVLGRPPIKWKLQIGRAHV